MKSKHRVIAALYASALILLPTVSHAESLLGQYQGGFEQRRSALGIRIDATEAGTRLIVQMRGMPRQEISGLCNYVSAGTLTVTGSTKVKLTKLLSSQDPGGDICPQELTTTFTKRPDGLAVDLSTVLQTEDAKALSIPAVFEAPAEVSNTKHVEGVSEFSVLGMYTGMTKVDAIAALEAKYPGSTDDVEEMVAAEVDGIKVVSIRVVPGLQKDIPLSYDPKSDNFASFNNGGEVDVIQISFIEKPTGESLLFDIIRANFSHAAYMTRDVFGIDRSNLAPTKSASVTSEAIFSKYAGQGKSCTPGNRRYDYPDWLCGFESGFEFENGRIVQVKNAVKDCSNSYPAFSLLTDQIVLDTGVSNYTLVPIATGQTTFVDGGVATFRACDFMVQGLIKAIRLGNSLGSMDDVGVTDWNIRMTNYAMLGELKAAVLLGPLKELETAVIADLEKLSAPVSKPSEDAPDL